MRRVLDILGAVPGTPFRGFTIGYLWFLLFCVVASVAVALSPVNRVYIWVPACFLAGAVMVLPVLAMYSRSFARSLRRAQDGDYWVRWEYEGDEWELFEEYQWREAQRETRIARYFTLGLVVIGGGIAGLTSRDVLMAGAIGGMLLLCGLLVIAQTYVLGLVRYRRRHHAAGEVRISPSGVLQPRGFTPISAFNLRLVGATVEPSEVRGPSMLKLVVGSMSEHLTTRTSELRVPIPYGKESEAAELVNRLLGARAAGVS